MTPEPTSSDAVSDLDSVTLAVMTSRLEGVVRAMLNTLLRTARTAVLAVSHDFSCCILTAQHELLAWAESLPVHVMSGPDLMAASMAELHPDFQRGDAYLHNSPYHGSSHPADWSILVPVFDDDNVHRFTVLAKAHQGDCGNHEPTTYSVSARDVYEEGALIFPCVKAQEAYEHNDDLIRMCQMRIRVPEQWWGDYLALVGAARVGERWLVELLREVGSETLTQYTRQWFDYSERKAVAAIGKLHSGTTTLTTEHDTLPSLGHGIPVKVSATVDAEDATLEVDLRDNIDCQPAGINLSESCARTAAMIGAFNVLGGDVPPNAGSFRRLRVHLREGSCVGIPIHPFSCSAATTDLCDRVANLTIRALTELGDGTYGMAEYGGTQPPAEAVISGTDPRTGEPFINQLMLATTGGPGTATNDGWLTAGHVGSAGMLYKDSVEIDEMKHPILIREQRILPDTEGAGRRRGTPGAKVAYTPVGTSMEVVTNSDYHETAPSGVKGGRDGAAAHAIVRHRDGREEELPGFHRVVLREGEVMISESCGGGGFGDPATREPELVAGDVEAGWITPQRARAVYRVGLSADGAIDEQQTARLRGGDGRKESAK